MLVNRYIIIFRVVFYLIYIFVKLIFYTVFLVLVNYKLGVNDQEEKREPGDVTKS